MTEQILGTTAELAPAPSSVGEARAFVRHSADGLPQTVLDEAELMVSELVSNAVRHGGPAVRVHVERDEDTLTVRVQDGGEQMPAMKHDRLAPEIPSGRGLQIVDRLAHRWGIDAHRARSGKTVWFQLVAYPTRGH